MKKILGEHGFPAHLNPNQAHIRLLSSRKTCKHFCLVSNKKITAFGFEKIHLHFRLDPMVSSLVGGICWIGVFFIAYT